MQSTETRLMPTFYDYVVKNSSFVQENAELAADEFKQEHGGIKIVSRIDECLKHYEKCMFDAKNDLVARVAKESGQPIKIVEQYYSGSNNVSIELKLYFDEINYEFFNILNFIQAGKKPSTSMITLLSTFLTQRSM